MWYTNYSERGGTAPEPLHTIFNEVFEMKRNLKNHPYAQCYTLTEGNRITFVSYSTAVIFITYHDGQRFVECTGTYSATTRKQIGYFLKEYAPDLCYYDMKRIAGEGEIQM
jgi:hypothetical protein